MPVDHTPRLAERLLECKRALARAEDAAAAPGQRTDELLRALLDVFISAVLAFVAAERERP